MNKDLTKRCSTCGEIKLRTEFYKNRYNKKDGCNNAINIRY